MRCQILFSKKNKSNTINVLFADLSSPEHKVLKVNYCDRPVSAVRRQQFLQMTSPKPRSQFPNNFTHMFLIYLFTKIAKMVPRPPS